MACMSYGSGVWYDTMKFDYARNLLNKCQRVVLYACLNMLTVSTMAMQVLYGELPWDLECIKRGMLSRIRIGVELADYGPVTSVQLLNERLMNEWQIRWNESDKGRQRYRFIPDFKFVLSCGDFNPSIYLCFLLTEYECVFI